MIERLTATQEERINFGVMNENPMNQKLNFAEIKKNTTLCLGYTFDFLYFRT
jgi:hypothetical protein